MLNDIKRTPSFLKSPLTFFFAALILPLFFIAPSLLGQGTIQGVVNNYTPVIDFQCQGNAVLVEDASAFNPGDEVLLIQMKGALMDTTDADSFGNILELRGAGNYELNRVHDIQGQRVLLKYKITRSYQVDGRVQLVRVPEYQDITATALACKPWDGRTGGVLVIDVKNTLSLTGTALDLTGDGFRGGKYSNFHPLANHETSFYFPYDPQKSAEKGEGIYDLGADKIFGRGKVVNGGGGGNAHNAGGGGGGSFGKGGRGGKEFSHFTPIENTFGVGGLNLDNYPDRVFLGGGGGSGNSNDDTGTSGGRGGGIAILLAKNIVSNNALLRTNGENVNAATDNHDGQSGGGAGGVVAIWSENIFGQLGIEAKGGKGGNSIFLGVPSQLIGPGGGGAGGGLIRYHGTPAISKNVEGGKNGIANLNTPYGAESGEPGGELAMVALPLDTLPVEYNISITTVNAGCDGQLGSIIANSNALTYSLNGGPKQDSGIFNGLPSGTYTLQFDFFGGCTLDTTITLTGESNIVVLKKIERCDGDIIEINDLTYTQNATVLDTVVVPMLCDTIVVYDLIFHPLPSKIDTTIFLCSNIPYIIDGVPFFAPATKIIDTIPALNGCDTLLVIDLVELPLVPKTQTIPLCIGTPFMLNGIPYYAPAVVFDTVAAQAGCDTLFIYDLLELPLISAARTVVLCPGSPFILDGIPHFAPETVVDTLPATGNGCDTVLILTLTETPLVPKNRTVGLCPGTGFLLNGTLHFPPKILLDTLPGTTGCDTLLVLNLVETPLVPLQKSVSLCPGDLYLFDGQPFAAPAILFDTLPATIGCDTMLTVELTEITPPTLLREVRVCPNKAYEHKGQNFFAPTMLFDTLPATSGCDTLLTIELVEIDPPILTREVLLCPGEVIVIGHKTYVSGGTVLDTLPGNEGCDTIRTTIIEVAESVWPFLQPDTSLCASETIVLVSPLANTIWNGKIATQTLTVTESGIYTAVATDANGCPARDSVLVSTCCAEAGIFVPNVFSPNGDGHNEVFRAFHNDICIEFTLSVYDRWGELIWQGTEPEAVWDGKFRGKSAPTGVYVWVLEIREGRKTELKKGNVTLLR